MANAFDDELFNVFSEDSSSTRAKPSVDELKDQVIQTSEDQRKSIGEKRSAVNDDDDDDVEQQSKKIKTEEGTSNMDIMQRIQVHTVETMEACLHEVAVPPEEDFVPLKQPSTEPAKDYPLPITSIFCISVAVPPEEEFVPLKQPSTEPAKSYPFILDPFQKEAILCLENSQSVLVSAHTSAGKTVVASYAIAMSLRDKQRVIYTTPIKALSNQKYREMFEDFQDVGLMTGDVTINPTASCLIMTTEILRSMLYRGSEIMREVGWVIFDEIHYMRDKERGVVWEETIILLPDNVHYVFLSATIPNARQFAEWICYLHRQPCHVVYTDYRPTPLQHYIYPAGGDGIHLVVDENGEFREDNFNTAMAVLADAGDAAKGDQRGRRGNPKQQESSCFKIVKMILERKFAPVIVFSFKQESSCFKIVKMILERKFAPVIVFSFKQESSCFKIVKMILERKFAPVIVFSFSKKDCEAYAMQMTKLDFNTDEEKELVNEVFNNAIDALSDEDKKLPQVEHVLPLLKKGIGIHHGGLLPLLKETIEILFSEGLIKALFATETFAMGLNMPARTVLFTSSRKFDGQDFRWVTSGEYIQMSGRAGRRGLDDRGIVILMVDEKMPPATGKAFLTPNKIKCLEIIVTSGEYIQMSGRAGRRGLDDRGIVILMVDEKMPPATGKALLKGEPDPLNSAFHLTYNMVLNLLRVEEINPEYMLERSFYQFQNYAAIPELCEKLKNTEDRYNNIVVPNEDQVGAYYKIRQQLEHLSKELMSFIQKPQYILPFLQPGRLISVKNGEDDFGWGMVVNFQKKSNQSKALDAVPIYVVEVLVNLTKESAKTKNSALVKPSPPGVLGEMQVIPVMLHLIQSISAARLYVPKDLKSLDSRQSVGLSIQEIKKRYPDGLPLLDPVEDMGIKEKGMKDVVKKIEAFEHRLHSHQLTKESKLEEWYTLYEDKAKVGNEIKLLKAELKKKKSLLQMDELKCRKRVLRRLGYCTASDVIEMKGRVACEISSGDELMTTELLFNGVFNDLTPEQSAALLSCFVFEEKSGDSPKLYEQLSGPLRLLQDTARRIARVSKEAKLEIDEEVYVDSFKPQMMDVVHSWCKGSSFLEICKMTDIFEGSVIRCMRRLEETLRQMVQAAKAIGNTELENKFNEGIRQMKRDIVFAASLYL